MWHKLQVVAGLLKRDLWTLCMALVLMVMWFFLSQLLYAPLALAAPIVGVGIVTWIEIATLTSVTEKPWHWFTYDEAMEIADVAARHVKEDDLHPMAAYEIYLEMVGAVYLAYVDPENNENGALEKIHEAYVNRITS